MAGSKPSDRVGPELRGRSRILLGPDDGECLSAAARQEGYGDRGGKLAAEKPSVKPSVPGQSGYKKFVSRIYRRPTF